MGTLRTELSQYLNRAASPELRESFETMRAREAATLLYIAASKKYPVRAAGDALVSAFSVAVRLAFSRGRAAFRKGKDVGAAIETSLAGSLPKLLRKAANAGGNAATAQLQHVLRNASMRAAKVSVRISFNESDPAITEWLRTHSATLVTDISKTTRDRLREALAENELDRDAATDAIEAIIGDEARAETIARTEALRAAHMGQRIAWQQAIDNEVLSAQALRVWIVTPDDRLCVICEPLDGETAGLDGSYESDGEEYDGPPAHPNCRCTEAIQF